MNKIYENNINIKTFAKRQLEDEATTSEQPIKKLNQMIKLIQLQPKVKNQSMMKLKILININSNKIPNF